jgi:hypothetical protein
VIADDLAAQSQSVMNAQPASGQNIALGLGDFIRFAGDELHPAGGAFGESAAGVKLIDFRVFGQRQHQAFAGRHFERSDAFNGQFGHGGQDNKNQRWRELIGSRIVGLMIRKLSAGGYRLYSRKKDAKTGRRRNLGTFKTRAAAEKHERAVQFFKRQG